MKTFTGLPSAAAPAARTAAAWSLSSVPEKRTRLRGSSIGGAPSAHGCQQVGHAGRIGQSGEASHASLEDAAHQVTRRDHVGIDEAIADLPPIAVGLDDA